MAEGGILVPENLEDSPEDDYLNSPQMAPVHKLVGDWMYPDGVTGNAILLYINNYVALRGIYIPSELAMVGFNVEGGIQECYWTLIDPKEIPRAYGIDAHNNAQKFGVPFPDYSDDQFSDYENITNQIEEYIEKYKNEKAGFTYLLCPMSNIATYTYSLEWLFKKADKEFQHEIFPVERVVVALSMCGIENLSNMYKNISFRKEISRAQRLYEECNAAKGTVSDLGSVISRGVNRIMSFVSTQVSDISYEFITKKKRRVACAYESRYPSAMIGLFLYEGQVDEYLKVSEFLHLEMLACPYHREEGEIKGVRERRARIDREDEFRPKNRLIYCAMMNAMRQVYLILDALLVNYPQIKPRKRKHYPHGY